MEELLHKWWYLRMELKFGIITQEEFDTKMRELFPDYEEGDPRDPLNDPLIEKSIRYITDKTAPPSQVDVKKI